MPFMTVNIAIKLTGKIFYHVILTICWQLGVFRTVVNVMVKKCSLADMKSYFFNSMILTFKGFIFDFKAQLHTNVR